ncbi:DUF885 domain-containing protein [Rhizorhabdus dicambivorans]|uniref:DUF885 domain-containing protein n=2 Tax=Rhizorhabdus dicambivorans TaxID=1850238 RepID=A0A2A4FUR1_9SPHN|nr:DUF885 domain-containing protein [Rhizorhabdus dicambivorans]PCE42165.1 DUF885 domain-containing protein [Rhizorhabdus dicambivorans]
MTGGKMVRNFKAAALLLAFATPAFANPADDAFDTISAKEWTWRQQTLQTEESNRGGIPKHLPDEGLVNQQKRRATWTDVLKQLDAIKPADLSPSRQEDYGVYRAQIETLLDAQRFRDFEKPLNSDSSFWADLGYVARQPIRNEGDAANMLSMMRDIPRYFAQNSQNMRAGLKRGFTPPKVIMAGRDASIAAIAEAKSPRDTMWFEPFRTLPASIPAARQAELRAEAEALIRDEIIPAYATLLGFMRDQYLPHLRDGLAAEGWPDGKAYYRAQIRAYATVDLPPEEIHAIGLAEVAKIRAQMAEIMKEVKFEGDFPAFLKFLRTDPQFYVQKPQDLLDRAAWIAKRFDGVAARWFGRMPRGRFGIVPVPADIAPYYTAGRGGQDRYLLNTYDLPSRPLFQLTALTLHESAPGHSWQLSMAAENEERPEWRRYTYVSAYGEGWALYTEKLGVEMGLYETPYDRFGMLSYQMWRAARLVIDTGIHSKGWTREQGIAFLRDNSALSEHEVTTEVDRYIGWPGQALSYYLGQLQIEKERARAEQALGARFDIRSFHDMILSLGPVPLPVITARTDRFIAEGGKGPWKLPEE